MIRATWPSGTFRRAGVEAIAEATSASRQGVSLSSIFRSRRLPSCAISCRRSSKTASDVFWTL